MTQRLRVISRGFAAVALVLALGACGQSGSTPNASPSVPPVFADVIDEAIEAGASDTQLAILRDAASRGELTFDHLRDAIDATYACLDENGISHGGEQVVTSGSGITTISYTMQVAINADLAAASAVSDECVLKNSDFVQQLNSTQPSAIEAQDAFMRSVVVPALTACFDEYGVGYDPEAEPGELWDLSFAVRVADLEAEPGDDSAAGCISGAMYEIGSF